MYMLASCSIRGLEHPQGRFDSLRPSLQHMDLSQFVSDRQKLVGRLHKVMVVGVLPLQTYLYNECCTCCSAVTKGLGTFFGNRLVQ